jgi:acyl-CoA thioester hydrolase
MISFRFKCEVPVRFVDVDAFGHVNNANYLTYAEEARIKYFDSVLPDINWKDEGLILASAKVDYVQPILLKDKLLISVRCTRIGNKSFELDYEYQVGFVLKAKVNTVLVAFNYLEQKSIAVPENWRKELMLFEGSSL